MGCKGITTFNADGKRGGVIVTTDKKEEAKPVVTVAEQSCEIDLATGRRSCE